jgi:hypothetical protein
MGRAGGADCVANFNHGPDALIQLAALTEAISYERSGMIAKTVG